MDYNQFTNLTHALGFNKGFGGGHNSMELCLPNSVLPIKQLQHQQQLHSTSLFPFVETVGHQQYSNFNIESTPIHGASSNSDISNYLNNDNNRIVNYLGLGNLDISNDNFYHSLFFFGILPLSAFIALTSIGPHILRSLSSTKDTFSKWEKEMPSFIPEFFQRVFKGFLCIYFSFSPIYNMINRNEVNLCYILLSIIFFTLADTLILYLYKSKDKSMYLHHMVSLFTLYAPIFFGKVCIPYLSLAIQSEILCCFSLVIGLLKLFNLTNSFPYFMASSAGLFCMLIMRLPKHCWIVYDLLVNQPTSASAITCAIGVCLIIPFDLLYTKIFLKMTLSSYKVLNQMKDKRSNDSLVLKNESIKAQ
ncbi:hypothetical protein CYY_009723 [Polysphondylium violaceum]|uniref:Transmembrane protein n=1 Tax=Polysphondylium violaceum TaxID=133409 RepID=A0A8J4V0A1_9MYCE|nr:hypothetical protein CYY_009723 [Polysphondylium violaceum]